jgi:nucleoid-associated protein YgaU
MKVLSYVGLVSLLLMVLTAGVFAQELSKEEWQKQITELTSKRNDLAGKLSRLKNEVENLKKQDADKAAALKLCQDELLAMTGADADQLAAYEASLKDIDSKLSDLSRLSNQDLWNRRGELDEVQTMIDEAKKNKLSALPKYYDQLADLQRRLDALRNTLKQYAESGQEMMTYTVGTWAKDRDCLWNIAKKDKIYGNAFLWPKIYQGNRDRIKNADVIEPGWILKIPSKAPLTTEEESAERSYWRNKRSM